MQGGLAGKKRYNNNDFTQNYKIDVSDYYNSWEKLDAHSFDVKVPEAIQDANIPQMTNTTMVEQK